jgi:magnesium-transporting ATPase (P-type)
MGDTATQDRQEAARDWHAEPAEDVLDALDAAAEGLDGDTARRRLDEHGPNELEQEEETPAWRHLLNQFTSPLIYILIVAGIVTSALQEWIDTGVIAVVLILNAAIGFTQERKAERSVQALAELAAPEARVLRDGQEQEVEAPEVVPGDVLLLEAGDRVAADARLLDGDELTIDESLLTGESKPVTKSSDPVDPDAVPADRTSMAFMGSNVTKGRGRAVVVATGTRTELGQISEQVQSQEETDTPLQERMKRLANIIGLVVVGSAALTFLAGLLVGRELGEMLLTAVALAVGVVPEGLPVVVTVTLALGVRRMAQRGALIRELPAVETLGSTSTIGCDKTGTLTRNEMTVQEVWTAAGHWGITEQASDDLDPMPGDGVEDLEADHPLRLTLMTGILTNEATLAGGGDGDDPDVEGEPTEAALVVSAMHAGVDVDAARDAEEVLADAPFESSQRYSAAVRARDGGARLYLKGAPERVLELCGQMATQDGCTDLDAEGVEDAATSMAGRGLRVLAMAYCDLDSAPDAVPEPENLTLAGLQGMLDPPRDGVAEAIAECNDAGVRVVMITGDHADTARAIAEQLGLAEPDSRVLTGQELEDMSEEELADCVLEVPVFARVSPEHKLKIIEAVQSHDQVAAVTGDGVNDAPALKAADIGVAMGKAGTDVAREASDMVLTDDDFVSIRHAVAEGRVTFDNIRKVTFFLLSTDPATIVVILASVLMGLPLPYVPAQLLWLNLVTNGLQDVALAFEPAEEDVLRRPPQTSTAGVLGWVLWERAVIMGLIMAAGSLGLFAWAIAGGMDLEPARTIALTTLVVAMGFHVFNARSERQSVFTRNPLSNPYLLAAQAGALALHVGALYLPFTQAVLRVEPFDASWWLRMVAVGVVVVAASEVHKLVRSRR